MWEVAPQLIVGEESEQTNSDAALVALARQDHMAFDPVYRRYRPAIYRFCYYRLGDPHESEDVTADIFLSAFDHLDQFEPDGRDDSFRCWLFTIARHVIANRHRTSNRRPQQSLDQSDTLVDRSPTPEESAIAAADHQFVISLLSKLKPEQRDLLELRLAGMNDAQISRVLGRSHASVRKEQSRTMKQLRLLAGPEKANQ